MEANICFLLLSHFSPFSLSLSVSSLFFFSFSAEFFSAFCFQTYFSNYWIDLAVKSNEPENMSKKCRNILLSSKVILTNFFVHNIETVFFVNHFFAFLFSLWKNCMISCTIVCIKFFFPFHFLVRF